MSPQPGYAELALVMRVDAHDDYEAPFAWEDQKEPQLGSYHGGTLGDEIASLVALALGCRMRSGGITRTFGAINDDPRGQPAEWEHRSPALAAPLRGRSSVLPSIAREVHLEEAVLLLDTYLRLSPKDATALVRAARGYERGLWGADDDPGMAWVAMIGAVEVAAVHWRSSLHSSRLEELKRSWPELAKAIEPAAQEVAEEVAKLLAQQVRSTARFRAFLEEFRPDPPEPRPAVFALDWSNLRPAFTEIYSRRSEALHGGTPIPWPMVYAPSVAPNGAVDEFSGGLGSASGDAYWPAHATPMYLNTFAYIARGALTAWWRSMAMRSAPN